MSSTSLVLVVHKQSVGDGAYETRDSNFCVGRFYRLDDKFAIILLASLILIMIEVKHVM